MICISPETARTAPSISGLEVDEAEWRLDIAQYRDFIEATTGIDVDGHLTNADCYRIGNRLEAFVEQRQRDDEFDERLVAAYPGVESPETIVGLARFFRACEDCESEQAADTERSA